MIRRGANTILAALVVGIALSGALVYFSYGANPGPSPPVVPTFNATLSVNLTQKPAPLSPDLLGINLRADSSINGTQGSAVAATSVRFVRWPGGGLADRYDPFGPNGTATIYSDNGTFTSAASTPADFVAWCRAIQCSAIVTVPGEIDQPALGAQEIRYFETDLGFFPAFWEIGNEPGDWDHYAVPWSGWQPNQTVPPSPTQYAELVHRYVTSMRVVDPAARFIGLPGIGESNSSDATWIKQTVEVNGPNLSAIALHIYPAGRTTNGTALPEFIASLWGPNGLPARVASARSAVAEACENCTIAVLVDEIAAATGPDSPSFLSGFPLVPYEATEAIQGMDLNVSSLVFWVADSGYSGSWVTPDGTPRPIYTLFASLLKQLPADQLASNLTAVEPGLFAAVLGDNGSSGAVSLLVANANDSVAFRLAVPGLLPSRNPVGVLSWDASTGSPVQREESGASVTALYVSPLSVLRVQINASTIAAAQGPRVILSSTSPISVGSFRLSPHVGPPVPLAGPWAAPMAGSSFRDLRTWKPPFGGPLVGPVPLCPVGGS